MHLQQRWQELKERELTAQQHNRQLLQQFDEAQDTLRQMLTLTAAMKTIRVHRHKEHTDTDREMHLQNLGSTMLVVTNTHTSHLYFTPASCEVLVLNLLLDL